MTSTTRILYVGGLGRSGSTLLERALAQFPTVTGLGETVYMWQRGVANDEQCGCGRRFASCDFWTAVGETAFGGWGRIDLDRVRELQERVDDVKRIHLLLDPRLGGSGFRSDLREYLDLYERLYAAVREVTGSSVIVDSSKITSLAYVLSHSEQIDLRLLHIVRDPRAVAHAWTKVVRRPEVLDFEAYMPRYAPSYMAMLHTGHQALLECLRGRGVPHLRVRYEDFAERPAAELRRVARFAEIGPPPDSVWGREPGTLHLRPVHTASGNPSRFDSGEVRIHRDEKWREQMPIGQRRIVTALTLPVLGAYRYPARVRPHQPGVGQQMSEPAADLSVSAWPTVTVVIPTHDRPQMMREALASVLGQDYLGDIEVVVVFDRSKSEPGLCSALPRRRVRVMNNDRTPGLAGARNTGILAAEGELVAFLDDDDMWMPTKLTRQVRALRGQPGAEFASTAMSVDYQGRTIVRLAGRSRVAHHHLLRSRLAMLHSSSFLMDRDALVERIGLVDETMPRSMAEDWDLLLRAAERREVVHVDEPLVTVRWGPTSYFADQWQARNDARLWMLDRHPGIAADRRAAALCYGKLAFGEAMLGRRREALHWSARAARADWRQPRTPLALLVVTGLLRGQWVVDQLNRRGHGI